MRGVLGLMAPSGDGQLVGAHETLPPMPHHPCGFPGPPPPHPPPPTLVESLLLARCQ